MLKTTKQDFIIELLKLKGFKPRSWRGNTWHGACPIHGGDNPHGFTAYLDVEPWGAFVCWTKQCTRQENGQLAADFWEMWRLLEGKNDQ